MTPELYRCIMISQGIKGGNPNAKPKDPPGGGGAGDHADPLVRPAAPDRPGRSWPSSRGNGPGPCPPLDDRLGPWLGEKGFVSCDRSTRTNLYTPKSPPGPTRPRQGKSFLQRLYGGPSPVWWPACTTAKAIGKEDLEELKAYLNARWKEGRRMLELLRAWFPNVLSVSVTTGWCWPCSFWPPWPWPGG